MISMGIVVNNDLEILWADQNVTKDYLTFANPQNTLNDLFLVNRDFSRFSRWIFSDTEGSYECELQLKSNTQKVNVSITRSGINLYVFINQAF